MRPFCRLALRLPCPTRRVSHRPPPSLAEGRPRPVRRGAEARLPRRRDARRRQDDLRADRRAARSWPSTRRRLIVVAPTAHLKVAVGPRGGRLLAPPRPAVVGRRRRAAGGHARHRHVVPAGRDERRRPRAARRATRSSSSTSCTTRPTTAPGAARSARRSAARGAGSRSRARRSAPTRARSRSSPTTGDEAVPDYEYGYGDALADGRVVRPVYFPTHERPDGVVGARRLASTRRRSTTRSTRRARASGCAPRSRSRASGCRPCCARRTTRLTDGPPRAAGRRRARDRDRPGARARHRRRCCSTRFGATARVVTSDDPRRVGGHRRVRRRAAEPWLVAVRMVSEGVDIPRLRVGVYATTTTTELFFRQAVGRFVRWTRGVPRPARLALHPRRPAAAHARRARRRAAAPLAAPRRPRARPERDDDGALALERPTSSCRSSPAISAVAIDAATRSTTRSWYEPRSSRGGADEVELTLAPPPPLAGARRVTAARARSPAARRSSSCARRTPRSRASSCAARA